MKILLIVLVLLVVWFVVGWTMGAHKGAGGKENAEKTGTSEIAGWFAHRFPRPSIDLCVGSKLGTCDDQHTVLTVMPPRMAIDIPQGKASRKLELPDQSTPVTIKYFDSGKDIAVQEWPYNDSRAISLFASKEGGTLLLTCNSLAPCKLKLK
jgi:hypothetical protein